MKLILLAGASAFVLTLATAPDASANPKNKFSEGSNAIVAISTDDSGSPIVATDGDLTFDKTSNIESNNVDIEVIGNKEMFLTVSGNNVTLGNANGGNNSVTESCSVSGGPTAIGCLSLLEGVQGRNPINANGGAVTGGTGSITFGANTFDNFGGINSMANNTGNNVAQVADTVMPIYAQTNFNFR